MATRYKAVPELPLTSKLSFRTAMLFLATFAAVFFSAALYEVYSQMTEGRQSADVSADPAPVVIDPKLRDGLAKVLAFDSVPNVDVSDPFIDRGGLSNTLKTSSGTVGIQKASSGPTTASGVASRPPSGNVQTVGGSTLSPAIIDARARHQMWIDRQKSGEYSGPESEVLMIDDLVPVGFASGGSGGDEVMLYSLALCQTFTFPVGTRFFDGWLSSLSQQEAVFTVDRGVRRKSFTRPNECKTPEQPSTATVANPESPNGGSN
jgi:hypothetical protein